MDDVGGAIAKSSVDQQLELFTLLIEGCQDAVKNNMDAKV